MLFFSQTRSERHKARKIVLRKTIFFLMIAGGLLFFPVLANAERLAHIQTEDAVFLFDPALRGAARELAVIYPVVQSELTAAIGWQVDFRPTVLLVREAETFRKMAGSPFFVAFAVPEKRLIVIDHSRMHTSPFTLEITLKHELCHLLLHRYIPASGLPRWLDEGVAQWASDGISELFSPRRPTMLRVAVLSGNVMALNTLSRRFPRDKEGLLLAYEESKDVVEYIISTFGIRGLAAILHSLREGYDIDTSLRQALSVSQEELERQWHTRLHRTSTWFIYLSVHLYEILFFLAALITICGFIRTLLKKRRYADSEEEMPVPGEE